MRFLPGILSALCAILSADPDRGALRITQQLLLRQDLDLSIVTREPGNEIGQLLRKERFVWAEAQCFSAHEQTPLPLAMFNSDCFCRCGPAMPWMPWAAITASPTTAPACRR